ncbi:N-acetyl-gamma-glutamyl-phosphate reductase [Salinibacter sp. 10B]|uniref:N-acetyl-gamma-glutamyl-phosphate reductase n=1 Tax=Salinibacter sp. 10B TaxID=1923971 RepID=UPI000CF3E350|nr:N-acetyl-gamma-glutamyl-phosphate reductase [Salinibacter sp. 10B]PQJ34110.1 N-acetyl-gamma-glutamyl-phosphate reductase [Salinibacter sp. 10B]
MTLSTTTSPSAPPESTTGSARVGVLHGASYVGGELIRILANHPSATLAAVTSRTFAGQSLAEPHASLRGQVKQSFVAPDKVDLDGLDAVLVAGEHGQSMHLVPELLEAGFEGPIVDLSADFRFRDADIYPEWFDVEHPAPDLLDTATYGLPEWRDGAPSGQITANPGCFATGITLALAPLAVQETPFSVHVTALTGASGSGAKPSSATHFPTRDGNVRPYKVLAHQHGPEILQTVGPHVNLNFVPASGPWTRGIWGTAQVDWPSPLSPDAVNDWFDDAYADAPFVRYSPGELPSLQPAVGTPFCDVGWQRDEDTLVVGFALDNLLKGAASQAVQNLNRALGFSETAGLLPERTVATTE